MLLAVSGTEQGRGQGEAGRLSTAEGKHAAKARPRL